MSRIKYYIFVFYVLIFTMSFSQETYDGDFVVEKSQIARALYNVDQEAQRGNYYEAIKILNETLTITEKIDDKRDKGIILSKLGEMQYKADEIKEAEVSIIRAINSQTAIDDKVNLAVSRFTYGLIHLSQNNYLNALDYFKSAKTIFTEEELHELVAEVTLSEAKAHIGLNNLSHANVLLDKAIILATKHELPLVESLAMIKSGKVAFLQGKYDRALAQTTKGSDLAVNYNALEILNEGYKLLSEIYSKRGQHELAANNLRAYIKLNDSILELRKENLSPEKRAQFIIDDKDAFIQQQAEEIEQKNEATNLNKLTTILSVALITILSLLTLSLYKNNNIRLKTNNMLYKKNEELLTEKERAEIAAKTKANFLSTVTHELRTPLYAVTGLTNMLLEEDPKPEQMQHLKSLKFSGDYLLTFINDILQINKIEANKVELDPEIFNLKNKVENVIAALNNSAMDNNIMIHFEYDKNLPEVFNGDQLKISQILINLIGNSIKFTKDGDIWVRVIKVDKSKKVFNIRLEVEDNGIGISEEKQQNMFESFSQGSVQINRKYGGTGLGLSIVKGLIDILKGKINMKSTLGEGTTFYVELPLDETKEAVKVRNNDYSKKLNNLDLSNVTILVVEDNKINQMITKKILNKMNLNCEVVDNGEEAVDLVRANSYDVVLMDIHMPGISGLEATKRIRSFDKTQTIFALTAVTLEDKMQEFDEAGFDDIISKPFKQEDFEKKLYAALSKPKTSASA
ncbi:MAG: response regulator [Bacteroidia bacterium]|nr:response regulator [Bacteroidia bacterium]NND26080.1 response regulator [Flavobacteriaceae bacterium]MBT8278274.1 response regulator [Bacteroidia bacterium]NNK60021.1 response regulator [Flavobacteriaceae bacterium]NNL32945.1 response regulator [Flavobacteriaceae bacterium]